MKFPMSDLLRTNRALIKLDISSNKVCAETGYIKKAEVTGDSMEVGSIVTYNEMRSVVTKAVDSDGELKVRPIEGMLALCDGINGNETLQELNVADNGIEVHSAAYLSQVLPTMA